MKDFKVEMYQMKQKQTRNSLNITSETKPGKKPTETTVCLQNISQTGTIHPGIFHGRTLWADSVSPRATTTASREQFKPIRIGENLVVSYNEGNLMRPRQLSTITQSFDFHS